MNFMKSWRFGFELELVLGDLGQRRFARFIADPMDLASHDYCRAVAADLSQFTGKPWRAARKKQRRTGYFVYPENDLDPLDWPDGLVAGVELVTPPLRLDEAEALRTQIREWVDTVDGYINTYPNWLSARSGWHINIDPGPGRRIDEYRVLLGADELKVLLSTQRYPSIYAAPQRHAYGITLLRYTQSHMSRPLLNVTLQNLLLSHSGRGKQYAINLDKLNSDYLELRHFGSESFFRDVAISDLTKSFLTAAEESHDSYYQREKRLLKTFDILAKWITPIIPLLRCEWKTVSPFSVNHIFGQVYFRDQILADVEWSGSATYSMRVEGTAKGPTIAGQPFPDLGLSIGVLALDVAEIRGRKLGNIALSNDDFSREVNSLKRSLLRADLFVNVQSDLR